MWPKICAFLSICFYIFLCFSDGFLFLEVQPLGEYRTLPVNYASLTLTSLLELIAEKLRDEVYDTLDVEIAGGRYVSLDDDAIDLIKSKGAETIRVQLTR